MNILNDDEYIDDEYIDDEYIDEGHSIQIETLSDDILNDITTTTTNNNIVDDIDTIYTNILDTKLFEIKSQFIANRNKNSSSLYHKYQGGSNSPLSVSEDDDYDDDDDEKPHKPIRQLSLRDVEQSLDKYYDDTDSKYSGELDILITFMKGQKNVYFQSYMVSQRKLNSIIIPALIITASVTIFAPLISDYSWNSAVISGLNAFTAMLISISNYLKLETSAQIFYNTDTIFENMETSLEFTASKLMFIKEESEKYDIILDKISECELKIAGIKEWNKLFIPDEIRFAFPIICFINIFSFIKRMESNKKVLIVRFKDVKNELRSLLRNKHSAQHRVVKRLDYLTESKEKIKEDLGHYRNAYSYIDELFTHEIKYAQNYKSWFPSKNISNSIPHSNPVVDKYIHYARNST